MALFPAVLERHRRALRVNGHSQLPFECVVRSQTSASGLDAVAQRGAAASYRNARPNELYGSPISGDGLTEDVSSGTARFVIEPILVRYRDRFERYGR